MDPLWHWVSKVTSALEVSKVKGEVMAREVSGNLIFLILNTGSNVLRTDLSITSKRGNAKVRSPVALCNVLHSNVRVVYI